MSWRNETCGSCEFFLVNDQLSDRGECRRYPCETCWENKRWVFYWTFAVSRGAACGQWKEREDGKT
jgi:hypothetical protein